MDQSSQTFTSEKRKTSSAASHADGDEEAQKAKERRQNPKATTSPRRATMPSSSERSCRSFIRRHEGRATIAGNLSSAVKVDGKQTLGLDYKKSTLYTAGDRIPRLPSLSGTGEVAGEAGSRRDRPRRRRRSFRLLSLL